MRAGLSQVQLSERSGKDRAQIARWERDVVTPSLETLRELLQVCGFDLEMQLVLYEAPDARHDERLNRALERTPQERLVAMLDKRRQQHGLMPGEDAFDPYALLQALERHRVTFIVIGALGRVLHGSDELTDGLDIVPSTRENLRRLGLAIEELQARHRDGKPVVLERDLAGQPLLELETDAGELKIVPEPAGTRGYDDLRRRAEREPIGQGLRPQVASVDDHARMLAVLGRDQDRLPLQTIQRVIELDRSLGRGIER